MDLKDKSVVITGGGSGIGAASAKAMSRAGARVVVADINGEAAAQVAAQVDGISVICDVGKENDVNALVETAREAYGRVDVFFSNAGIASGQDPLSTPLDEWQRQWDINVMAHVYAVRAVLPEMLERGSGYLIHTASMAGILTTHANAPYATTKHAVVGLAEWLSITYHDKGVRTSLLAPLGVETPMLAETPDAFRKFAAGPIKTADEVAAQVMEAVAEDRFLILTDPIAQTWMDQKNNDLERWLTGMRRLQLRFEDD